MLWFELSKHFINTDKNIIVGVVYIPPESSKYSNREAFASIESEMHDLISDDKYILLAGDFNARTGELDDYLLINHDTDDNEYPVRKSNFADNDVTQKRQTSDKTINTFGRLLIEMCRANNLLILNGRIDDFTSGKPTCKGISVVDYFIASYHLMKYISYMSVGDTDVLFF